uniref:Uncharacterized protein n=1 Tax=Aplysina aerophoba bacterial symbiont clone pAPKS18 TaxID=377637 RepID=A4U8R6_9BACT|nr:hypothetical protein [Aplysina aerophoba bacterial symbiont clone pAPKS18]
MAKEVRRSPRNLMLTMCDSSFSDTSRRRTSTGLVPGTVRNRQVGLEPTDHAPHGGHRQGPRQCLGDPRADIRRRANLRKLFRTWSRCRSDDDPWVPGAKAPSCASIPVLEGVSLTRMDRTAHFLGHDAPGPCRTGGGRFSTRLDRAVAVRSGSAATSQAAGSLGRRRRMDSVMMARPKIAMAPGSHICRLRTSISASMVSSTEIRVVPPLSSCQTRVASSGSDASIHR